MTASTPGTSPSPVPARVVHESILLHCHEPRDNSDKLYRIEVAEEPWHKGTMFVATGYYGRRGSTLRETQIEASPNKWHVRQALYTKRDEQLDQGYRLVDLSGIESLLAKLKSAGLQRQGVDLMVSAGKRTMPLGAFLEASRADAATIAVARAYSSGAMLATALAGRAMPSTLVGEPNPTTQMPPLESLIRHAGLSALGLVPGHWRGGRHLTPGLPDAVQPQATAPDKPAGATRARKAA